MKHDSRVIREATSLKAAGYDVQIIGTVDRQSASLSFVLDPDIPVTLVPWQSRAFATSAKILLLGAPLMIATYWLLAGAALALEPVLLVRLVGSILICGAVLLAVTKQVNAARSWVARETGERSQRVWWAALWDVVRGKTTRVFLQRFGAERTRRSEFLGVLKDQDPAIVHCHDPHTLPAGVAYKRRRDARLVFDSHEYFEDVSLASRGQLRRTRRLVRRSAEDIDAFITVNESIADMIADRYPNLPDAVVIKNAAHRPTTPVEYDGRLHDAAGVDSDVRILLYQGGFSIGRGLEQLVRTAPKLPPGWQLVMMGGGNLESELHRIANWMATDGESRVSFLPPAPQSRLANWTAGAAVGVIPYEPVSTNNYLCSPNKLWEYPAAGVPVLASPLPELQAVIEQFEIGWILEDVTPHAIASVIERLGEQDLRDARAACATFIGSDHWGVYEERFLKLYRSLIPTAVHSR